MIRDPENYIPSGVWINNANLHPLGAAEVGATVTFTALATGGGPFQYQWRKGKDPIPGPTAASLTFDNVQLGDAGRYTRRTTNPAGSVDAGGELQVTPFHGEPIQSVTYLESPRQTVNEGATVRFSVAVVGGTPPIHFQWYFGEKPLPGASEAALVLHAITPDQQGFSSVAVSNESYARFRIYDGVLTVTHAVPVPPQITLQPVGTVQAAGTTATFEVKASGSAPLTYQWHHNGKNLPGANTRILTLADLHRTQTGPYTVVVTNRGGSITSHAAWLQVYGGTVPDDYVFTTIASAAGQHRDPDDPNAVNLLYEPTDVALDDGGNVFVADSRSHSIRKIAANGVMSTFAGMPSTAGSADGVGTVARFIRAWGRTFGGARNAMIVADRGNASLRIIAPDGSVLTMGGNAAQPEVVNGILSHARFADPVDLAFVAADGETAVFEVTAEGTEPLSYQWPWQGRALPDATTRMLTLANARRTQAGFNSVVITNAVGAVTSDTAQLIVHGGAVPDDYVFTTFAGAPNAANLLSEPTDLAIDTAGDLYVADRGNFVLR